MIARRRQQDDHSGVRASRASSAVPPWAFPPRTAAIAWRRTRRNIYPFNRSYAEALAPTSPTDPFRPSSVHGIHGIGWVDEISGAITAIDKGTYDAVTKTMSDNSDVGAVPTAGTTANPFTGERDPTRRGACAPRRVRHARRGEGRFEGRRAHRQKRMGQAALRGGNRPGTLTGPDAGLA